MPLHELNGDGLMPIPATTFAAENLKEREDLQRVLKQRIGSLEEGLLVLTEEFDGWVDSLRRIDLLCLDRDANLVVVELKRSEDGGHMELQALRYAAMVAEMTFDRAVEALARSRSKIAPDKEAARADILTHLGWAEPNEGSFAEETRIILAAADFSKELTTTVLWLRDHDIDIRCVRLKPYKLHAGQVVVDIQQLIPLPETGDFQTKLGDKRQAERKERAERHDLRIAFLGALAIHAQTRTQLHATRQPQDNGVLGGHVGKSGFSLNYVTRQEVSRVELLIQAQDAKGHLARLKAQQDAIERDFGAPLVWQEKAATQQCRIYLDIPGGYRSPEAEWPAIHEKMVKAMIGLDRALRTRL